MTKPNLEPILNLLPALLTIAILIALWQVAVTSLAVPEYLVPSPARIIASLVDTRIDWLSNASITLYETVGGFAISATAGIFLAIALTWSSWLKKTLYPLIIGLQIVPKVALAPILLVVLGFGYLPRILVAFLVSFFPVVVDTTSGLEALDQDLVYVLKSLGSSKFQILRLASVPFAMPYIFNGLKVSVTLALVGAVVAEFIQANDGLGYLIVSAQLQLSTATAFAALALLTVMGFALYGLLLLIESLVIPWYRRSKKVERIASLSSVVEEMTPLPSLKTDFIEAPGSLENP